MSDGRPKILHCLHDGSAIAGIAEEINAMGLDAAHHIALGTSDAGYDKSLLRVNGLIIAKRFPAFGGGAGPGKLIAIGQALADYDLVVTYGWDAINVALAHKVFGEHLKLPPLIHHEDGSADFAASEKGLKRKILRRIAMGSAHSVVTRAPAIGAFAQKHWSVPGSKIAHQTRGIDLKRFRPSAKPDALPGLVKRPTEYWIGAYLAPDSDTAAAELVQSLKELPRDWHLVLLATDNPTDPIRAVADTHELSHRVHLLGSAADEAKAQALFDIYVELAPAFLSAPGTMEAMAAATPVVRADTADLAGALDDLIEDSVRRKSESAENRKQALAHFDKASSAKAFVALYSAAIGQ